MNAKPISENQASGCSPIIITVVGLAFFIIGLTLCWWLFVVPLRNHFAAQDWVETNCTIISAKIEKNTDGDGSSYRPVVKYKYSVDQNVYEGDRVSFTRPQSSSKRVAAESVLAKFHVGVPAACFYDPQRPERAVLEREFSKMHWWNLLTLLFAAMGGLFMLIPLISERRKAMPREKQTNSTWQETQTSTDDTGTGNEMSDREDLTSESISDRLDLQWDVPQKLKPTSHKLAIVIGIAVFSLIWNGIIGVMIYNMEFDLNFMSIFLMLFMTPFLLVGVLMIVGFFHQLLALFNPKIEIAMSTGAVSIGGEFDIAWEIPQRSSRIRKLTITIEGVESATYQQGTDTKTDTQLFANLLVVETTDPQLIPFGNSTIEIPESAMHTFSGRHNKIQWSVNVHGEIAYWPDVTDQFAFRVKPEMARSR